ncbi:hypothetical protein B9Z55_015173 [Caenorhabditis nigoni]|uniref:Uncharacterized protein n=1 Tax=Caenorhabditis nigoni TaxID=1611254 RepID=A0A2G5U9S6_9PELO|nr:hypothetical protein B9Z55_015173 [Caenorhabditis nigoni]
MWLFGSIVQIALLCNLVIPTVEANGELADEFEHYRECLEKVEKDVGEERKIKVVHAVRGADVILPCFTW